MTDNDMAAEHRLAALQRAQDEVLRLEGECARLRQDAERSQSEKTAPALVWHSAKRKPDAEITVLCWRQRIGDWNSGWWSGEHWYDAAHGGQLRGVTHWAEPEGPKETPC